MAVESYVEDILKSPESTFRKILITIVAESDKNAKIELVRQYTKVDDILFEAIKSILDDLRLEEGFFSRFLYRYFNIEIYKNKKREQLIILGTQLKTQYKMLELERSRAGVHISNLLSSLENLKKLKNAFDNKRKSLRSDKQLNKSNTLIKRINGLVDELNQYKCELDQKYRNLADTKKLYTALFNRIPRYYELEEERHLYLLGTPASSK